jgi:UrcA family protein
MTLRLITIVPLFVLLAGAEPASAAEGSYPVAFRYEAGELAAPGGAERVYRRLSREAFGACTTSGRKSLREAAVARECYARLVAELVEKIGDAGFSAIHAEANGERRIASR